MQRPGFLTEEIPKGDDARSIQIACDKNDHEDTKRTGRTVFPAIVPGAVVLDDTRMSRENSIQKKVIEVRAKNLVSDERVAFWVNATQQFCETALSKFKHTVSPLSSVEVNEIMDKPSQRAAYERLREWSTEEINKIGGSSFIKKEPAASAAKCSRAITTAGDEYRHQFSRYTIAISEVLKTLPFYVPGKTPAETAHRVHERAAAALQLGFKIFCADSKSHDGHRSELTYRIIAEIYLFLLTEQEGRRLVTLLRMQSNRKIRMTNRTYSDVDVIAYWIATTYGSGYPDTSLSVTLSLIVPAFATMLEHGVEVHHDWNAPPITRHLKPRDYLECLIAHGGDDTCDMGMNPQKFQRNCEDFDYEISPESYTTPFEPLTLLARTYPSPATTPGSYSDIRRVLTKIGITCTQEEISSEEVFARKGLALLTTDPGTPVLSQLGKCLIRSAGTFATARVQKDMRAGKLNDELSYQARQCVYSDSGYPQCDIETPGLVENYIANLGGSPTIIDELCTTLDDCRDIRTYVPPLIPGNDWISPVFAIIGGAIVLPGQGVVQGIPVLPERESAGYSVCKSSWAKKPPQILIPDTHAALKMASGRTALIKLPDALYKCVKEAGSNPEFSTLPRVRYESDARVATKHLGQLKLFLSFLYLHKMESMKDGRLLIIGSNPGHYLPLLKRLTGVKTIHTYDIKRQAPPGSDRHTHSARGTVSEKNLESIATEHWGWHVHCDIRTATGKTDPTGDQVHADNMLSIQIARAFKDSPVMLKYRCTFEEHVDKIVSGGQMFLQPYAPLHSTETRLYYPTLSDRTKTRVVDKREYEQRMCAFNRIVRPFPCGEHTWERAYATVLMAEAGIPQAEIDEYCTTGHFASEPKEGEGSQQTTTTDEPEASTTEPGSDKASEGFVPPTSPPTHSPDQSTVGPENRSPNGARASRVSARAPTRDHGARNTVYEWREASGKSNKRVAAATGPTTHNANNGS